MTPHYFYFTLDFVLVVLGPLLVALAGTVAALRRAPGAWRTALFVGLGLVMLVSAAWWRWSLVPVSLDDAVLVKSTADELFEFERDLLLTRALELTALVSLAAVVWAALLGREPRRAQPRG